MTQKTRALEATGAAEDPVATRIRTLRMSQGLSYKKLSEAAGGLATSFLFNIEHGRKVPGEDVAARIAVALGDGAYEQLYRAWARVKSRGRNGRADHESLLGAWERLRVGFASTDDGASAGPEREGSRDAGRLRVPVLAAGTDPGDGVRPESERVVNTLSLDPSLYGGDAARARDLYSALRRPFAFPLDAAQAARAPGLPTGYLAVVSREPALDPDPSSTGAPPGTPPGAPGLRDDSAHVVRAGGRLEVVRGAAFAGAPLPDALRAAGLADASALRAAYVGRIALLLPDMRR